MSSYQRQTIHPLTGQAERAEWLDDYFGSHSYGVLFPSDNKVFKADEFKWYNDQQTDLLTGTHQGGVMTVEDCRFGKKTTETKHEDGRQDVRVEVTRLDIENRTPEDTIAEGKIIEAMSKKIVRVVVIHKPTNDFASFDSPLPLVRKRAEEVAKSHHEKRLRVEGAFQEKLQDYVVVEYDADQIRVTSL